MFWRTCITGFLICAASVACAETKVSDIYGTWQSEESRGDQLLVTFTPDFIDTPNTDLFGDNRNRLEIGKVSYAVYDQYVIVFPSSANGLGIKFIIQDQNTISLHVDQRGGRDVVFHRVNRSQLRNKEEIDSFLQAALRLAGQVADFSGIPRLQKRFEYIASVEGLDSPSREKLIMRELLEYDAKVAAFFVGKGAKLRVLEGYGFKRAVPYGADALTDYLAAPLTADEEKFLQTMNKALSE